MTDLLALAAIVGALTVGVVSPGPSFVVVARIAVAGSRAQGLASALGMGLGGLLFAAAALLGLQAVFHAVPALYLGLKLLGGGYLCWLGWLIFKHAHEPLPPSAAAESNGGARRNKAFWIGFSTQVSNPKTAIVYASVFAAFLPPQFSPGFAMALLLAVFAVESIWYGLVALLLSSAGPQRAYLRFKAWIDRGAGAVMGLLGLRLLLSAWRGPASA